jgi:toxin FitB
VTRPTTQTGSNPKEATGYLLDTNVISETRKKKPDANVQRWLEGQAIYQQHISVITLGELLQGAHRAPTPEQESNLIAWIERTEGKFTGRILELDAPVMRLWASITAKAIKHGLTAPLMDSLLAATAIHHDLIFVTRNTDDVQALGGQTVNPWQP